MTGGKYYRADNAQNFQAIYGEIDKLEKTEAEVKKYAHHDELFAWIITPGLGLFLLEMLLRHTRLEEAAMKLQSTVHSPQSTVRAAYSPLRSPHSAIRTPHSAPRMTFANPHILWLLLVIPPALVVFFWWSGRKRQQLLTQFIQARLLPALTVGISAARRRSASAASCWRWSASSWRWRGRNGALIGKRPSSAAWTSSSPLTPRRACWRRTSPQPPGAGEAGRARTHAARQVRPAGLVALRRRRVPAMPPDH